MRAPGAVSSAVGPSFDALDDAHITIGSVTECTECLLIPGTVMRRDGLRDAIKLEEDRALIQPTFIDARRQPAREETAPCRLKCRASEPGICSESFLVADRAVHGNPICFSHGFRSLHVNVNRPGVRRALMLAGTRIAVRSYHCQEAPPMLLDAMEKLNDADRAAWSPRRSVANYRIKSCPRPCNIFRTPPWSAQACCSNFP